MEAWHICSSISALLGQMSQLQREQRTNQSLSREGDLDVSLRGEGLGRPAVRSGTHEPTLAGNRSSLLEQSQVKGNFAQRFHILGCA